MNFEGLIEKYAWFIDFIVWAVIVSIVIFVIAAVVIIVVSVKRSIELKKRLAESMREFEYSEHSRKVSAALQKLGERFKKGL